MTDKARRERFLAYFERNYANKGGRAALMAKTGMKKARVSQLFDPKQPFGELTGRRLAEKLGLPGDYFETTTKLSPRAAELARMFDAFPDGEDKDKFFALATWSLESRTRKEAPAPEPDLFASPNQERARSS